MASKKAVLRKHLKEARTVVAATKRNLENAPPELSAYWRNEWRDARSEVQRLERAIAS